MWKFYSSDVLREEGHFFDEEGIYGVPPQEAVSMTSRPLCKSSRCRTLPAFLGFTTTPALPSSTTTKASSGALSIQPEMQVGDGQTPDELVAELAVALSERLPQRLSEDEAGESAFIMRGEYMDSLSIVLKQEIDRDRNKVIAKLKVFEDIQRAIRGEVLMSSGSTISTWP